MAFDHVKSAAGRRELRRLERRRRADKWILIFFVVAVALLYLTFTLGRGFQYAQEVEKFVTTLDRKPSAEVKAELERLAKGLNSTNPLIRRGAMTAMRAATGWKLGANSSEWRQMWEAHGPNWEYRRVAPTNHAPSAVFIPE